MDKQVQKLDKETSERLCKECKIIIYKLDDYLQVKQTGKEPKDIWKYMTVDDDLEFSDHFIDAADDAWKKWGYKCDWNNNPPTFVAVLTDGKAFKTTVHYEDKPRFCCDNIEDI